MANTRYVIKCESCEADMVIRSTASIGKKIECPKCKFRFVCPDPNMAPDDNAEDAAAPKKTKGTKKSKKKAASGGNSKVLIGVAVGVLAIAGLVGGYFVVFADDTSTANTGSSGTPNTTSSSSSGGGSGPGSGNGGSNSDGTPPVIGEEGNGENEGNEGNPGGNGSGTTAPPPRRPVNSTLQHITNLLPNDTQAVWHLHMDELAKTPLQNALFDKTIRELFRTSMLFDLADVSEYIHCYVGVDRRSFSLIRTRQPIDTNALLQRMDLEQLANGVIKGRYFYKIKSNPFVSAMSNALTLDAILGSGEVAPSQPNAANVQYAISAYDDQTLLIGEQFVIERFLSDLQANGYPTYLTEMTRPEPTPPPATNPGSGPGGPGGPGVPGGPGGPGLVTPDSPDGPGGPGRNSSNENALLQEPGPITPITPISPGEGEGQPYPGGPGGFGGPGGPPSPGGAGGTPRPRPRLFTSNPNYRTVNTQLKKALNLLQDEDKPPVALVYADMLDQRTVNNRDVREAIRAEGNIVLDLLQSTKVMGLAVTTLDKKKASAVVYFDYLTEEDALKSAKEQILPLLTLLRLIYILEMKQNLLVRDQTTGQNQGQPGGGPGFPGGGPGYPSPGGPGGFEGGPGEGEGQPYPGGPGGFGGPGGKNASQKGSADENTQGPPPPPPPPPPPGGGPGQPYPGGPGGFGGPGEGGGSNPFPGSGGGTFGGGTSNQSVIDVRASDTVLTLHFELVWNEETYDDVVLASLNRFGSQLRGRMSVLSGQSDWFALVNAIPKLTKSQSEFPQGTFRRELSPERYNLPYPPEQRVSFMADLLPYLGRGSLRAQIDTNKSAWYSKKNLQAAEAWVPEFLVPSYPQTAWRAEHELAEGKSLGATNYVAVAGLGLDAARMDPSNPEHAKRVGLVGYDFGSKVSEVTDGLSNTMYMLQVPPGIQRPWIAGGGATVTGINDQSSNPQLPFIVKNPDGTRGTHVLMGDGSVRFVREGTDPAIFRAMATRAGGESLQDLDKLVPKLKNPRAGENTLIGGGGSASTGGSVVKPQAGSGVIDEDELKKFQGKWKMMNAKFTKDGKTTMESPAGLSLPVSMNNKSFSVEIPQLNDGSNNVVIMLDPKANPKVINFYDDKLKKTEYGIYEFKDANTVRVCVSGQADDKPTRFELGSKGEWAVFELVRDNN